jgi:putative addiction module component (TIGR02574 family)
MTETLRRFESEISRLSVEERAEMAQMLLKSLDEGTDADAESAWDEELSWRVAEVTAGTATGESAERVFTRIRKKLT